MISSLRRYIEEGYNFICIGGITPNPIQTIIPHFDRIWRNILTNSQGMPKVKIHGLACTSFRLLQKYPLWSVDSATWTKLAAYGNIFVPKKTDGRWDFAEKPLCIYISQERPRNDYNFFSFTNLCPLNYDHVNQWLNYINLAMGDSNKKILGVTNDYQLRMKANLICYQKLMDSLPAWPWRFRYRRQKVF